MDEDSDTTQLIESSVDAGYRRGGRHASSASSSSAPASAAAYRPSGSSLRVDDGDESSGHGSNGAVPVQRGGALSPASSSSSAAAAAAAAGGDAGVDGAPQRMGLFGVHPPWLQRFGTPGWFLVCLCLFTLVQAMVNSGLFPVIISSIERQFGFTSTQAGWIVSSYDVVSAVFAIIITNYGHRSHRPRWLARGMTLLGVGCFLVTVPHWISAVYKPEGNADADLCVAYAGPRACTNMKYGIFLLFVLAQAVLAVGSSPLYTLGSTFVDDNVPPKLNSTYMGIFYSMGAAGPAIGYVVGGLFLRLWVDAGQTTTLNQNSAGWVGNWWAPFLLAGSLGVLLSLPLYLYPRHLPGMEWVLEERRKAKDRQQHKRKPEATLSSSGKAGDAEAAAAAAHVAAADEGFAESVKGILTNKPFIFAQLGFTLEAIVIVGLGAFLPKVVQTQFHTTSSNASFLSGGIVVFGAAGGILSGGLISRRWTMKRTARNVFIMGFSALMTIPCFLVHCSSIGLAGLNRPYPAYANLSLATTPSPAADNSSALAATCNLGCDCRAADYKPVCGGGLTFFSACHAGCAARVDATTFSNCSCLPNLGLQAADGPCEGACLEVVYFLLGLFLLLFITFMINVPGTVFCMRVVSEQQRSLALGIGSAIQRIGGAIPGPIILGAILDSACSLWDKQCDGSNGACWEYDSGSLARDVFIASFVLKSLSSISFFLAWHFYRPASAEEDAPEADLKATEEGGQGGALELGELEAGDPADGPGVGRTESDS